MASLSSFSPSIWRPWRFLPWSPCLHLKMHGAPLVLFSVNLAPLTFSSLVSLLALETAWRPSRPFLHQFDAPDVFFPRVPACTCNCMAPLSSFSPPIWCPWRFLPWSHCLNLKLHGASLVILIELSFFLFSFLLPLSSLFYFLFPSFPLFPLFSLSLSFPFLFSFFLAPLGDLGGPGPPKPPPRYAPAQIWQWPANLYQNESLGSVQKYFGEGGWVIENFWHQTFLPSPLRNPQNFLNPRQQVLNTSYLVWCTLHV